MTKVDVKFMVTVTVGPDRENITIIDSKGRVWEYDKQRWHLVTEVPDDPDNAMTETADEIIPQ